MRSSGAQTLSLISSLTHTLNALRFVMELFVERFDEGEKIMRILIQGCMLQFAQTALTINLQIMSQ